MRTPVIGVNVATEPPRTQGTRLGRAKVASAGDIACAETHLRRSPGVDRPHEGEAAQGTAREVSSHDLRMIFPGGSMAREVSSHDLNLGDRGIRANQGGGYPSDPGCARNREGGASQFAALSSVSAHTTRGASPQDDLPTQGDT